MSRPQEVFDADYEANYPPGAQGVGIAAVAAGAIISIVGVAEKNVEVMVAGMKTAKVGALTWLVGALVEGPNPPEARDAPSD